MSVMDIFRIIFEADSADAAAAKVDHLKDITKGAGMAADEAKKAFLGFGNGLVGTIAGLTSYAAIIGAAIGQIHSAFAKIPDIEALNKQGARYGTTGGNLDLIQRAGAKNGATADDMNQALKLMEDNLAGTGRGAKQFQAQLAGMGIPLKDASGNMRDTVDIMTDISAAAHKSGVNTVALSAAFRKAGMTSAEANKAILASKVSLGDQIEKQKELGYWTKETTDNVHKYSAAVGIVNTQLKYGLAQTILNFALPALTKIYTKLGEFISFLREHETFTKSFFIGIASVIGLFLLPMISTLTIATLRWLMMFMASPIGWAIAGIMALALAFDDLEHYIDGGNSALGYFLAHHKELKHIVDASITHLERFGKAVKNAWAGNSHNALVDAISGIFNQNWDKLGDDFQRSWNKFKAAWSQSAQNMKNEFSNIGKAIKTGWDNVIDYLVAKLADMLEGIYNATGLFSGRQKWAKQHDTDAFNKKLADRRAAIDSRIYAPVNNSPSNPWAIHRKKQIMVQTAQSNLSRATAAASDAIPGWVKYAGGGIKGMFAYNNRLGGNNITNNINAPTHIEANGLTPDEFIAKINEAIDEHQNRTTNALISASDSSVIK